MNYKFYIITFFLGFFLHPINSQELSDFYTNAALEDFTNYLSEAKSFRDQHYQIQSKFEKASNLFCYINSIDSISANKFIERSLHNSFLEQNKKYWFLILQFECFSLAQRRNIYTYLNQKLLSEERYFHQLVSLFQIKSKLPILMENADTSLAFLLPENNPFRGSTRKAITKKKVLNLTTLANLGNDSLEDSLLTIYKLIKNENYSPLEVSMVYSLYKEVLKHLHSKKSVLHGLHIMEKDYKEQPNPCLTISDPAEVHYLFYISAKIKDPGLDEMAYTNFKHCKKEMIELIKTDNSIWKSYIRIGNPNTK